ncbi:ribokinase [Pengzhenrongella phosphoraccumulans]|uniref:ribokinase n=1 Tax=Pengzhenrongella phosphoraccumulans TaxID=3114394 RepID=UPI00388F11F3
MSTHTVVVVGSANADLVLDVHHRPAAGETILGSDVVTTAGGKGANQAVAAGRIGGQVAFIGCVGDDDHGALLRASLAGAGVDLTGLRTVAAPTGNAIIIVTPDGENSIIVSPAANRQVSPQMLDELESVWAGVPVLVVQLEIPIETVTHLVPRARARGGRIVVNAAPAAALPAEVLVASDPLVVNESEAEFLLGRAPLANAGSAPSDVAADLLALGPRSVVLTLGSEGAVLLERDDAGAPRAAVAVPAKTVSALDTTGAGDAFVGALAVELAAGAGLEAAVRRATEVAAFAVGRRGAQASYPTLAELASR